MAGVFPCIYDHAHILSPSRLPPALPRCARIESTEQALHIFHQFPNGGTLLRHLQRLEPCARRGRCDVRACSFPARHLCEPQQTRRKNTPSAPSDRRRGYSCTVKASEFKGAQLIDTLQVERTVAAEPFDWRALPFGSEHPRNLLGVVKRIESSRVALWSPPPRTACMAA